LNKTSTTWFRIVRTRFITIAALALISILTASCQTPIHLLVKNDDTGKTYRFGDDNPIVVVPAHKWLAQAAIIDELQSTTKPAFTGAEPAEKINSELKEALALRAAALEELQSYQQLHLKTAEESKAILQKAEATAQRIRETAEKKAEATAQRIRETAEKNAVATVKRLKQQAEIAGTQSIQFSNRTNSQLAGCSSIGIIEVLHNGTINDALIILKNEAYRLNTNILVPLTMNQTDDDTISSPNIQIEARMMRCPLKLARGN
jgi:hypothetical protein